MGNSVTKCCKMDLEAMPEKQSQGQGSFDSYNTKDYGTLFDEIIKEKDEYNKQRQNTQIIFRNNLNIQVSITDFHFIKMIGQGGFGKVILVEDKRNKLLYAMKIFVKEIVQEKKLQQYIMTEKNILKNMNSNFIVKLHYAFQNPSKLYLVMDFMQGGDLLNHLLAEQRFSEEKIGFYAAQIILGIDCLHKNNVIYRDLKPQNILMDKDGNIKLSDFGLSKETSDKTYTFCGTPEYFAPELILNEGHNKSVDWWSLGILIFVMAVGSYPFFGQTRKELYDQILNKKVPRPRYLSDQLYSLIEGLLTQKVEDRLGTYSTSQIQSHPFFKGYNWKKIEKLQIQTPYTPKLNHIYDVSCFDQAIANKTIKESLFQSAEHDDNYYDQFTYQQSHLQK